MKWIAAGQKVKRYESFARGRLWASGYVVADNGIDIEDAFICIPLPSYGFGFRPYYDDWRWYQNTLMYLRSRGWSVQPNYDAEQYT